MSAAQQEQAKKANPNTPAVSPNSPKLNKFDMYLQDYLFSHRSFGGAYHSFAMQLSSGHRVYGHVRRYLSHHIAAESRIDVGRRGVRAMVLLTRATGGENFYHSLLKTVESLSSHRYALNKDLQFQSQPEQKFLHAIHVKHSRLSAANTLSKEKKATFQALTVSIKQIELGNPTVQHVDYSNFLLPQSLLLPHDPTQITTSPMLPLLRCLGIGHTLRLFSALMCERRIILVSQSTSRLSACASAATSILAQGLLHWQHIYLPILPPSMLNYLAAPMPYLIGVTADHQHKIEHVQGLGEVLVVYLDENDIKQHNMSNVEFSVPDILNHTEMDTNQYQQQQRIPSIAEVLKLDLINVMKIDRQSMRADSGGIGAGAVKEKSKDLLKRGFGKLKKVAKKQIEKNRFQNGSTHGPQGPDPPGISDEAEDEDESTQIYAFNEGFDNQAAEDEAKVAFTTFFLSLIGDMRWYLRPQNGAPPTFDKELFLASRQTLGDNKNSPLYPLLVHFKESQVFEMFVKARVAEVIAGKQPSSSSPLFIKALSFHKLNRVQFAGPEIRNIVRQISASNPNRHFIQATSEIRRRAMALTSNSRPEHLVASELGRIAQDCREGSSLLVEVMRVVWERIRSSRGMQWKHGYFALQMLLELILHGPLAAIAEANDGIDKIRRLKFYEHMRSGIVSDMRRMATSVYNLLVNRARLFSMRRVCALRRMEAGNSSRRVIQKVNKNLRIRMKFNMMHALVKPGTGAVSPLPTEDLLYVERQPEPAIPAQNVPLSRPGQHPPSSYGSDLLSMVFSSSPTSAPAMPPVSSGNNVTQMMSNVIISQLQPPSSAVTHPTIAAIPPLLSAVDPSPAAPATTMSAGHSYPIAPQQYQPQMLPTQQHPQFHSAQQAPAQQQHYQHVQQQAQQQYLHPNPTQANPNSQSQFDPFA